MNLLRTNIRDAMDEVARRLGTKDNPSKCALLFGGFEEAQKLLASSKYSVVDKEFAAKTSGKSVQIGRTGGFFTTESVEFRTVTQSYVGQITTFSSMQASALVILHELGHRGKIYGENDKDDGDKITNDQNTEIIREACFSDLKSKSVDLLDVVKRQ